MKQPRAGRNHSYPKTGTLANLADSYRPNERPVYESEPVRLATIPPDAMTHSWHDGWYQRQIRSDFVDAEHRRQTVGIAVSRKGGRR